MLSLSLLEAFDKELLSRMCRGADPGAAQGSSNKAVQPAAAELLQEHSSRDQMSTIDNRHGHYKGGSYRERKKTEPVRAQPRSVGLRNPGIAQRDKLVVATPVAPPAVQKPTDSAAPAVGPKLLTATRAPSSAGSGGSTTRSTSRKKKSVAFSPELILMPGDDIVPVPQHRTMTPQRSSLKSPVAASEFPDVDSPLGQDTANSSFAGSSSTTQGDLGQPPLDSDSEPEPRAPFGVGAGGPSMTKGLEDTNNAGRPPTPPSRWDRLVTRERYQSLVAAVQADEEKKFTALCTFRPTVNKRSKKLAAEKKKKQKTGADATPLNSSLLQQTGKSLHAGLLPRKSFHSDPLLEADTASVFPESEASLDEAMTLHYPLSRMQSMYTEGPPTHTESGRRLLADGSLLPRGISTLSKVSSKPLSSQVSMSLPMRSPSGSMRKGSVLTPQKSFKQPATLCSPRSPGHATPSADEGSATPSRAGTAVQKRSVKDLLEWDRSRKERLDAARDRMQQLKSIAAAEEERRLEHSVPMHVAPGSRRMLQGIGDRRISVVEHACMLAAAKGRAVMRHRERCSTPCRTSKASHSRLTNSGAATSPHAKPPPPPPSEAESISWWLRTVHSDTAYVRNVL